MGFSAGTDIARPLIKAIMSNVPASCDRRDVYRVLITVLEEADWDTQNEVMGIDEAFDDVMYELHPDWERDSGEDYRR